MIEKNLRVRAVDKLIKLIREEIMAKANKIEVEGSVISVVKNQNEDYVSLTDMAKFKNSESTGLVISHWLSTRFAIDFLGIWEQINNPNFNVTEFSNIRMEAGTNGFVLTSKQWIERTNAVGIVARDVTEEPTRIRILRLNSLHGLVRNLSSI